MRRITMAALALALLSLSVAAGAADPRPTPACMGVYGSVAFRGAGLDKGDELRAYTPEGLLVGKFAVEQDAAREYGIMAVYGDDASTAAKDGAAAGDSLRIVLYRASDGQEHASQPSSGTAAFAAGGDALRLDLTF